jgi:hypothetical protein
MSRPFQAAGTVGAEIIGTAPKLQQHKRNHRGAVVAAMMVGAKTINCPVSVGDGAP